MTRYLYRISTKVDSVWSRAKARPLYLVAESKEEAAKWATERLAQGLMVARVTRLAEQVGGTVFVGF